MRAYGLAIGIVTIVTAVAVRAADLQTGNSDLARGDYAAAIAQFRSLAESGNAIAQLRLGTLYANGLGVQKDLITAHALLSLSAASNNTDETSNSLKNIASMMTTGQVAAARIELERMKSHGVLYELNAVTNSATSNPSALYGTESAPSEAEPTTSYANQGNDAYSRYVRTGQLEHKEPDKQQARPSFADLGAVLATYNNLPLDAAINSFGYPDAQQHIAGRTIYLWSVKGTEPLPNVSLTTGDVGNELFSAVTYGGTSTIEIDCKVTMEVNDQKVVTRVFYDGNMLGCSQFMKAASIR